MKIIRLEAVTAKTGLKHSAIYERMHAGTFPRQVRMGPRAVGWIEAEVDAYIEKLMAERDATASSGRAA